MLRACIAIAAVAGCYDGSVTVELDFAPSDGIERIRAAVYLEPSGQIIDCDQLAFGKIPADTLEASELIELEAAPGETLGLGEIPRLGTKLFFAEALTAGGISIVAGCAELGTIEGHARVVIEGEPRKTVLALDPLFSGETVGVRVSTLAGGDPVATPIDWELLGPAGFRRASDPAQPIASDELGRAAVPIEIPDAAGPARLDLRVRWGAPALTRISGFLDPESQLLAMPPGERDSAGDQLLEVGALDDQVAIVALGPTSAETFAREVQIHCIDGDGALSSRVETADGARTLAHLDTASGEKIVAIADAGDGDSLAWKEYGCAETVSRPDPFPRPPDRMVTVGGCDSAGQLVYAQSEGEPLISTASGQGEPGEPLDLAGGPFDAEVASVLTRGGCADSLDGPRPTVVFAAGRATGPVFTPLVVGLLDEQAARAGLLQAGATAIWLRRSSASGPAPMVVGEITAQGPALTRLRLFPIGPRGLLGIPVGSEPMPSLVLETASGDVDGDGLADLVSLMPAGASGDGNAVAVHVSLALPDTEERLSGTLSAPLAGVAAPRLRVFDIDGDGIDDIVVGAANRIVVLRMGP